MRFRLGGLPNSPDFVPDESWRPIREFSPWRMQLIALPIGIVMVVLLAWLWFVLTPLRARPLLFSPMFLLRSYLNLPVLPFLGLVLSSFILIFFHELVHAFFHPAAGFSSRTTLGCWPSRFLFYSWYDGGRPRNREIVGGLAPLFVLSFLPLAVAAIWQIGSGWAALASCVNALGSCGDILGVGMFLAQVPSAAIVRNKGWCTYWRILETAPKQNAPIPTLSN